MTIVKLTLPDGTADYINTAHIQSIFRYKTSSYTTVSIAGRSIDTMVLETPEEIMKLLGGAVVIKSK